MSASLERHIVGVKLLFSQEDFDKADATAIQGHLPYCVMVKSASKGHGSKAKVENFGCMAAARALGMTEVSEQYLSGEEYMGFGIFNDTSVSQKVCENITIVKRKTIGVMAKPLKDFAENPDVVIIVSTPFNVMRLVQGYNYHYGTYTSYKIGGLQAMCGEVTSYPYESGDINISMLCAGTRFLSKWDENELALGVPYSKFENMIDGLCTTINPLERDGNKMKIEEKSKQCGISGFDMEYGKNYDTAYYRFGQKGVK